MSRSGVAANRWYSGAIASACGIATLLVHVFVLAMWFIFSVMGSLGTSSEGSNPAWPELLSWVVLVSPVVSALGVSSCVYRALSDGAPLSRSMRALSNGLVISGAAFFGLALALLGVSFLEPPAPEAVAVRWYLAGTLVGGLAGLGLASITRWLEG